MKTSSRLRALCLLCLSSTCLAQTQQPAITWIAAWTTSPEPGSPDPNEPVLHLNNQTVRERARVSIGGTKLRIRLSNEYGSTPLVIGQATVALSRDAISVDPASLHPVTFNGRTSVTIPAGAPFLSDPIDLPIKDGTEISISLYLPNATASPTWHDLAMKHATVSPSGDHTQYPTIQKGADTESTAFLTGILVPASGRRRVIVAFGDSIIDGDGSTTDKDRNLPGAIARRLQSLPGGAPSAVVNEGIAGNRLLHDGPLPSLGQAALARFNRDALSTPGVTDVLLLEGINDISFPGAKLGEITLASPTNPPSADDIIAAYRQLIARAHAHHIRIYGATLTPCEGVKIPGYNSDAKERTRQAVNQWIRTSNAFDAVIDFDRVLRDPAHPARILPRLSAADHLHPNDAGYQAMADAIDLTLFTTTPTR